MILNKAIIFDIDGTLSEDSNRVDLAASGKLDLYNKYARFDKPNSWATEMVRLFRKDGYTIFFVTGRSDSMRTVTINWLQMHLPFLDNDYVLIMKTEADPEDTCEFKRHRYLSQIAPDYDVLFVVEDRKKLVDCWRALGLTCLQCLDRE